MAILESLFYLAANTKKLAIPFLSVVFHTFILVFALPVLVAVKKISRHFQSHGNVAGTIFQFLQRTMITNFERF